MEYRCDCGCDCSAQVIIPEEPDTSVDVSLCGTKNYKNLSYKPSINGVTLIGNLTSAEIGIIDDNNESEYSTYSSKRINSLMITQVLQGTEENPTILSNIEEGKYVISGYVKVSETSEPFKVPQKTYIVTAQEDSYVLWDANPYAASQYYVVLPLEEGATPIEKSLELITKDDLQNASLDGGAFSE